MGVVETFRAGIWMVFLMICVGPRLWFYIEPTFMVELMDKSWCWMLEWGFRGSKLTLTLGFRLSCGVGRTSNSSLTSILTLTLTRKQASFTKTTPCHGQAQPKRPAMRRAGPRQRPRQTDEAAPLLRTRYRTPPSLSSVECRVNQGCIQMNGGESPHQRRGSTSTQPGNKSEG